MKKTLFDKVWDAHVVDMKNGPQILYIDKHLIHEVTSPQAFMNWKIEIFQSLDPIKLWLLPTTTHQHKISICL